MSWIVAALALFIIQLFAVLILEFRYPSKAVAWMVVMFLLPLVGFVMYYFLATEYRQRRKVRRHNVWHSGLDPIRGLTCSVGEASGGAACQTGIERLEPRLHALLSRIPEAAVTYCNEVKVLTNAQNVYPEMLEAMAEARHHIHFEFYIMRDDGVGQQFKQIMQKKAQEGVKVRCIFDGIGSYQLSRAFVNELKAAGVEVYFFLPALLSFFNKRINYRNHRKIVVVDGKVGFLGGINIGDEHLGADPKLGFWRDTHLKVEGDSVYALQHTFFTDWLFVSGRKIPEEKAYYPQHRIKQRMPVQIVTSGPDAHWDAILELYFSAIVSARRKIYITTPYFIPDPSIRMALKTAAVSGIDVRIIYPDKPDSRIVNYASLSYMEELLQAGVRFYAYRKGFIHAKIMLVDDLVASVGTANLDMRSFFSNFELNAVMFDEQTIRKLEQDFEQDLLDSRELLLEQFEQRSRLQRGKEVVGRLLSPLF